MIQLPNIQNTLEGLRNFLQNQSKPTLLVFTAPGHNGLLLMQASIKALKKLHGNKINFFHLQTDQAPEITATYQICQIPTFLLFNQDSLLECIPGLTSKHQLINRIELALSEITHPNLNQETAPKPDGTLL